MLNSTTHSNAQRYALSTHAVEVEERLPITEDAKNGLSSLAIGLIGALAVAIVLLVAHLVLV